AAAAVRSVYLIAVEEQGERRAVGTAFGVRPEGLLATAAHVALELKKGGLLPPGTDARALAVRTDSDGEGRVVVGARLHPAFEAGSFLNDVALLQLAPGPPLEALRLARRAELARLRRGIPLASFGFPFPSTDVWRPRGRLTQDVLGDIRGERYLEVGLGIVPGTSGSPIFIRDGVVVGIVLGGDFPEGAEDGWKWPRGVNWGLSVAPLREMLEAE
ncbi:MAG: trypsin-like peptidase domain-containing protein, partial [Acidobacteriota bacterium]